MGRRPTRDALFTSFALLFSAVSADITIGPPSSPLSYVNATGKSGTTLVPFSVTLNSIPSSDWDNVTYLNTLRSSAWNWGVNVTESSDAKQASDLGTTQSVVSLSWPIGDGPEVGTSPWAYCALYIPEMGDSLLKHSNGNCADNNYSQCEKAVVLYLATNNILTDTHFTCSGQQTIPIPNECKTAFGSDAPSQLTLYASNSMTSGSPFISRTDSSQSLTVGTTRPFEVVLFELAKITTNTFPAAIFINCFAASTAVAPILAKEPASSSSSFANPTTSSNMTYTYSGSWTSTSSPSAENYLTASSNFPSTTKSSSGSSGSSRGSTSSHGSSAAVATSATTVKPPAAGGLGAASSFSEGVVAKMAVVVGAYVALLVAGLV